MDDTPDHTEEVAAKINDTEPLSAPSKGMLKSSSTAQRFKVAPVAAGKITMRCAIIWEEKFVSFLVLKLYFKIYL